MGMLKVTGMCYNYRLGKRMMVSEWCLHFMAPGGRIKEAGCAITLFQATRLRTQVAQFYKINICTRIDHSKWLFIYENIDIKE